MLINLLFEYWSDGLLYDAPAVLIEIIIFYY